MMVKLQLGAALNMSHAERFHVEMHPTAPVMQCQRVLVAEEQGEI